MASNKAVVAAFSEILGKRITVHPNNRISGAIGAAIASAREMERNAACELKPSRFIGLEAVKSSEARTFECRKCSNRCQVTKVISGDETSYFGDICERYSSKEGEAVKSAVPDLFRRRETLLESYAGGRALWGTAGIPRSSFLFDTFPFWATFLRSLGFKVILSPPTIPEILERGARRLTAETCLPIKLTFGHVAALMDRDVDFIFLPSIRDLPDEKGRPAPVCPYVESAPFMVSTFARERLVAPELSLSSGKRTILDGLHSVFSSYGATAQEISEAYTEAMAAQQAFVDELCEIGKEYLRSDFSFAFVLLGKPYNCHDPFLNLNLTQHIRKLGILPIPADMLPDAGVSLEEEGITVPWHYNRQNLRGLLSHLQDRRLFPVIISNFGCGPDAFSMKYLDYLAPQRPHLFLEFDEHRGEAGLITRLEAFIDEIRYHTGLEKTDPPAAVRGDGYHEKNRFKGKRFVITFFADHARAYAGALKFDGYDVTVLPMPDEETLVSGEEFSSGKECHPYTILIGDLIRHTRSGAIGDGDIFFFPGTTLSCLLSQYAAGMRMALERLGKGKIELFTPDSPEHIELFSLGALTRLWRGFVTSDLLIRAGCQLRPYTADPVQVDRLLNQAKEDMVDIIAGDRLDDMLKTLPDRSRPFP
ncbi:MAG: acyl-CoA dehydratase activase-related protein [Vulcanimicrobiota bacterium]